MILPDRLIEEGGHGLGAQQGWAWYRSCSFQPSENHTNKYLSNRGCREWATTVIIEQETDKLYAYSTQM